MDAGALREVLIGLAVGGLLLPLVPLSSKGNPSLLLSRQSLELLVCQTLRLGDMLRGLEEAELAGVSLDPVTLAFNYMILAGLGSFAL